MILQSLFKKPIFKTIVTTVTTTSALLTFSLIAPSTVEARPKSNFFCKQDNNGVWTTFTKNNLHNIPIVRWTKTINRRWNPQTRCQEVSKRFNSLYDNGWLNDLTSGEINNQNVICGVRRTGDRCTNRNILLTINTGDEPDYILKKMFDLQARARGKTIYLSGNKCFENIDDYQQNVPPEKKGTQSCIGKKTYYHVDNILDQIIKLEEK